MSAASHAVVAVHVGDTIRLAGLDWTLRGLADRAGPNYAAQVATVVISRHGRPVTVLHPERRSFPAQGPAPGQTTTAVAIRTDLVTDLYAVLGDVRGSGADRTVILRLHRNPLAPWIWLGGLLMALGGALSLSDRRIRVGAPRRALVRVPVPAE